MDPELTISRDLTEKEEADLRKGLTSQLNITTLIQDEEDAEMLLEYAFDMIKGGENIGQVVEELLHMEMSVCGEEEGEKIGVLLTDFYNGMGTAEEAAAKEAKAKEMEAKMAALAAKKKAEEEEAALRAKEEEELAAAKKAEEEAAAAAAEIKKADEAAKAAARKRRIEEAEAAEAKKKEEEAAAAAAEANRLEEEAANVEAKRVEEAAAAAKIAEEETDIKEQSEEVNADEEVAIEVGAQAAEGEAAAKKVEEVEAEKDVVAEKAHPVEAEATGTTEEVDSVEAATNVEEEAHVKERTEEEDVLFDAQKRTEKAAAAMRAIKKAQEEAKLAATKKTEIRPKKVWTKPLSSGSSNVSLEKKEEWSSRRSDEEHLETTESKPVNSEVGDIIHAPMSRDLAGIRRGELEKIKQSRSNLHISIRGHWEDRVQTNDQTHVSLVAQARAKVEKGASLTRYLELQEASKRGIVDAIDEESRELGRDVQPPGDSPTNTNFQRLNSRETAKIFEAQIERNEEAIDIAPADIAMYSASNQGDHIDFKAHDQINQLQHGFEEDWQSAEEAAKERMGSFRGSTKNNHQRTITQESEDAQLAKAEVTGPDVSMYGDAAISNDSNRKGNSDYVPMPDPIPGDLGTSKSTEASDVDETGEKPKEVLDVIRTKQTPVIGSASGIDVGEVSDGSTDRISKDQMPIIQYGEAPVIYEGDETVGENRAQDWHEQATKDGEAVDDDPIQDDANENVDDDKIVKKTEDANDAEVDETEAAKSEEELAAEKEVADAKRAEEAAAAAAKKAEEKAQRKAERKAAKKAKRAEEKAAAKKAEEEAVAAAAAEAARIKAEEEALKKNCTGCIIS